MKSPWEWTEEDLRELITLRAKEGIELEFKQSDALQITDGKKNEISKDVSAFANSAGGTLVYGIIEDDHVAKDIDHGSDPSIITKEWLEQVINSRIQRKIDGVRIKQIELRTNPGHVVYVPQSLRAPHQAHDKRFYKRYNFESVPLEEYEIRDISRRAETPDLRMEFYLTSNTFVVNQASGESDLLELSTLISNDAIEPAFYALIELFVDERLTIVIPQALTLEKDKFVVIDGRTFKMNYLSINWSTHFKMPIFNSVAYRVSDLPISVQVPASDRGLEKSYLIGYQIRAPKMPVKESFTTIDLQQEQLTINSDYGSGEEIFSRIK